MALLQISDPRAAPKPVGIDLGTTNSLVAYVAATGKPVTILDCDNEPLVPSVVHYAPDGSVIVGRDAKARAVSAPEDTIVSVKRFMGRGGDDPETRRLGPYRFVSDSPSVVKFRVTQGREVTPVEVSAEILRALRAQAEDVLGPVGGVVITVPAYFDDAQRQATKDAGRLAGLEVLRLVNEPTAAALAYGLDAKRNGLFAVYDLGGGTFDVTILSLDDGVFQVRSTGGDSQLGGDDMDRALAEVFLREMGIVRGEGASPALVRTCLDAARRAKHALTDADTVELEIEREPGAPKYVRAVTRSELDALVRPLVEKTGVACRRALRDAGVTPAQLDGVILVGGSTRVPLVRAYVTELFGKPPLDSIDPDQVVALGAAIQADLLAGTGPRDEVLLLDVLPLSLGVETMGGVVERILPRNTAIPAGAKQVFTTYADNQTGFEIHVVQGERDLATDCRSLAHFTLRGIPPMTAGMARLEVTFNVDADGLLHVTARELVTGVEQRVEVKPTYGLADEDIERMLLDAYAHGDEDVKLRALREEQVEGDRILMAVERALAQDAALLENDAERVAIEAAMSRLREAMRGSDHHVIASRIEDVDHASAAFAGRRMNRSIQTALAGRTIDDVDELAKESEAVRQTAHAEEGR